MTPKQHLKRDEVKARIESLEEQRKEVDLQLSAAKAELKSFGPVSPRRSYKAYRDNA